MGGHSTTSGLTVSRVPATGPQTSSTERGAGPARNPLCFDASLCGGGLRLLAPTELGAIDPHTMEHDPELAGQRHLGPLEATAPGHVHRPALERGEADRAAQDRIGGLVKGSAHHRVAALADPANHVRLTGLVALWRQPEMRPDRLGGAET